MPEIDIVDDTWLDVPPSTVGRVVADGGRWRGWWPDLDLAVDELRGAAGVRWQVRSARKGTLTGSMEIWLQPVRGGTVAHYFLRLDGTDRTLRPRTRERLTTHYRRRAKRVLWAVADELDPARLARVASRSLDRHG